MNIFRRDILRDMLGVWVWDTDMQGIQGTVERVKRHGYNWIAVKAQDGASAYRPGSQQLDTWRHVCERHGIHFGVWGFLYGQDPYAEAHVAAEVVNHHGAQFYIADAESGYENNVGANHVFANVFQHEHPHLPKALSSFGRIDFHPLDWHTWKRHGYTFMPQAYADVSNLLHPATCIEVARGIWHPSEMAVTLEAAPHISADTYGQWTHAAARLGVRGFNIWRADLVSDQLLDKVHHNR